MNLKLAAEIIAPCLPPDVSVVVDDHADALFFEADGRRALLATREEMENDGGIVWKMAFDQRLTDLLTDCLLLRAFPPEGET